MERCPRTYFQIASSPKTVSGQRKGVTVCLTSAMHSAPMEINVSAIMPTTPSRRLRQLQRTARTHRHRKCERSTHRCASWLRRRSDCSWRRRSPASSAAAVKRMIRTRYRHIAFLQRAHAARAQRIERNSTWLSSTWFNSAQLILTCFNFVQLSTTQFGSALLNSTDRTGLDFTSQLHLE